jgi:hypothetical protein
VQEREILAAEMLDVGQRPRVEVIDTDHAMTARQQRIAQMRAEKAAATSHKAGGHGDGRIAARLSASRLEDLLGDVHVEHECAVRPLLRKSCTGQALAHDRAPLASRPALAAALLRLHDAFGHRDAV